MTVDTVVLGKFQGASLFHGTDRTGPDRTQTLIHGTDRNGVERMCEASLVPRPCPKRGKRVWCSDRQLILVTWGGAVLRKECHNCVFISGPRVSDASVHMDYYTARFAKARKIYWDSRKHAARQVFAISDSFQNTIAYVMQL